MACASNRRLSLLVAVVGTVPEVLAVVFIDNENIMERGAGCTARDPRQEAPANTLSTCLSGQCPSRSDEQRYLESPDIEQELPVNESFGNLVELCQPGAAKPMSEHALSSSLGQLLDLKHGPGNFYRRAQ